MNDNLTDNTQELSSTHAGREVIYNLFYRTFIDSPDKSFYDMIEALYPSMIPLGNEDAMMKAGIDGIGQFINERKKLNKEELKEFDLDTHRFYTRILCLTDSVPTVESYYTSPDKLAMQDSRDEVLAEYCKHGMIKSDKYNEYEDFISNEMLFISFLAKKTVAAINTDDEEAYNDLVKVQLDFINNHILVWIPQFVARLGTFKEAQRLYLPMAKFMEGFIKFDKQFLTEG